MAPPRTARSPGGEMSNPINIRDLAAGTRVVLATGVEAEIVSNPKDGI